MGYDERERRYRDRDPEEEVRPRRWPSPGKRSLTHSGRAGYPDRPPPGKVPATLTLTGEGEEADAAVRARVEATTGADLSAARVHLGADSQEGAAALRARAFTVGRDIHFAAGQYRPGTPAGDALLAHELVHTLQQSAGPAPTAQLKSSDVSQEGDPAEREADLIARAATSGAAVRISPVERAAPISLAPETLTGNPAERTDPTTGRPTTHHRSIGPAQVVGVPGQAGAGHRLGEVNVKVMAPQLAPLHLEPPYCPPPERVLAEDHGAAPPAGFTRIVEMEGTVEAPQVRQELSKSIYIGGKPKVGDIEQGVFSDCYLMANLLSIVTRDPGKIPSMMAPDGKGGAIVTFWRCQTHTPTIAERIHGGAPARDWIQVNVEVSDETLGRVDNNWNISSVIHAAHREKSSDYWARVTGEKAEVHRRDVFEVARWVPLIEKAYARFIQSHGQYGGWQQGNTAQPSGYDMMGGGNSLAILYPFYGPQIDDPGARAGGQATSYAPGSNVVLANAGVIEALLILQGRDEAARPDDPDAPVLTAGTPVDDCAARLGRAIPAAQADPDYANVDAGRQAAVTAVAQAIALWQPMPPDPSPPAPQPRQQALIAVGTACGQAVRPGLDEGLSEKATLTRFAALAAPIHFAQGSHALPAGGAQRVADLNKALRENQSPQVDVHLDGHGSSEGSDARNLEVSEKRVDAVETALLAGGAIAPHSSGKTAHGEQGATADPSWRRVDVTVTPTGHRSNSLLDPARSRPIQDMVQLMLNLRNVGTDHSPGQRNVYLWHAFSVVSVSFSSADGKVVPLNKVSASQRAALLPAVDPDVSTVRLRNPYRQEPDRRDRNQPERPGDGDPSGGGADGLFTVSLREFFLNFEDVRGAILPKT